MLFSIVGVATAFTAFLFDWNGTHLFNPTWPGHARFHDAQTMFLALGLCLISLLILWSPKGDTARDLALAWLSSSFYWVAFLAACLAPGTTLFDPGFEIPRPLGIPANLFFGLLMLLLGHVRVAHCSSFAIPTGEPFMRSLFRPTLCLALFPAALWSQTACAPPLPDWLLPSEEKYSELKAPEKRLDFFDKLHYIPVSSLGEDSYLLIGGQERQWYEAFNNPPFGNGPKDSNGYLLQRYMLHFDLHWSSRVRFFVEFKGTLENGRIGGPRPDIDEDRGDLNQAFMEITLSKPASRKVALRIGRQEMVYGSGRLVDMREGPNVRRGFDGAKLTYCSDNLRLDAFAARPVTNPAGAFDDVGDHRTIFAGLYATRLLPAKLHGGIDAYYFAFDQKTSVYARGAGHEQRHSIGTRIWRDTKAGWDYDLEALDQFGRFGSRGIQAWGVSGNTGYIFASAWQPRVGVKTGVASGDSGAHNGDLGTFNPLFASLHYFGEEGLAGPSNFYDLRPELDLHPRKAVRVSFSSDWFWRHKLTDGIYLPGPVLLVGPSGSKSRYVGNLSAVEVEYDPSRHWTIAAYTSHLQSGQFLRDAGRSTNLQYVAGWVTFHF